MNQPTTDDVIEILKRHPENVVARRWLKDPTIIQKLLDKHLTWNEDHRKINEPDMIFPLEVNVEYALSLPETIDMSFRDKQKERP
ncbi:hypothetical protein [Planococcus rifietoensis]|uniref:hypothetical protein n=1 Tax=Planococcus rifietoensis TaxID=200991 RepID=UPI00384B44AC